MVSLTICSLRSLLALSWPELEVLLVRILSLLSRALAVLTLDLAQWRSV